MSGDNNMNSHPTLTIWQAAEWLAPAMNEKQAHIIARTLIQAAEAGELPAIPVAPPAPLPLLVAVSRYPKARTENPQPKTIGYGSPVDFCKVCEWWASAGYALPDKALELLPSSARAALSKAKTLETAHEAQAAKIRLLLAFTMDALTEKLPPKFRHGGAPCVNYVVEAILEKLQSASGATPHGWKRSTLAALFAQAKAEAAAFMKSNTP